MGQSAFADALVQTLLGWLRWLADIAWSLLQGGSGFLRWFSSHWVALLVGLIIACLFVDWLIWMLRWRPYWLWFRKKRPVLLDDDATARRAVEFAQPKPQPPRFHSSALRNEREDEEAFYEEMEDMSESASMFDEEDFTPPAAPARPVSAGHAGQGGLDSSSAYAPYDEEYEDYDAYAEDSDAYDAAEGEDDGEALDSSAYSQYMRPENAQAPKAEEEVKPLSRRERRMFFEGDENGEDDA